jgi:diacylglycerol kinase family enzyme
VVINPVAGGGRLLRHRTELDAVARGLGLGLEWLPTERRGHGEELARRMAAEGRPLVLAYGGDGTYNEVGRGLVGTSSALGVLPGGTTSVLAYELGVPRPALRALPALVAGDNRVMRPGRTDRGEIVLVMLSSGPDAVVLEDLGSRLKRVAGRAGVAAAALRELLSQRPLPRLVCSLDGGDPIVGGWVIVGRSRCYAGPYHATPGADPFGSDLEVVIQRGVGRRPAIGLALMIACGAHVRRRDVVRRLTRGVRLEAADRDARVPYQIDGDPAGGLPVEVGVLDRELLIRIPAG